MRTRKTQHTFSWIRQFGLALLTLLTLNACALSPIAQKPTFLAQQAQASPQKADISAYTIDGRIMVRQGEQRHATHLSWQHSSEHDEILLATPLGQGLAELRRDAQGAHLRLSDQRQFQASDWESLASEVFGVSLPLNTLPRWLLGQAIHNAQSIERDLQGRTQYLRIDGWHIAYLDYADENPAALPTLIELRREDLEIRIKIDQWTLPTASSQTPSP